MESASPKRKRIVKRTAHQEEDAFLRLRNAILTGAFSEGAPLMEARLAREWGIGRTPFRQAVRRAAEFGYLTLRPNKPPIIRRLSADDIKNIYSLREALECLALEAAWDALTLPMIRGLKKQIHEAGKIASPTKRLEGFFRIDKELHGLWIGHCGNPWLVAALDRLFIYRPNQITILRNHPGLAETAYHEHVAIAAAMAKRDGKLTKQLLRQHIRNAGEALVRFLQTTTSETEELRLRARKGA